MRPVLLIGAGRKAAEIEAFAAKSGSTIKIVRRLSTDGGDASMSALAPELSAAYLKAEGIGEAVIAADEPRGLPMGLLFQWKVSGIAVTDYQTFWEREAGFIAVSDFDPAWFVYADGCRRGWTVVIKRVLDIVLGVALLVATAPLFCLCALLSTWKRRAASSIVKSGAGVTGYLSTSSSSEACETMPNRVRRNGHRRTILALPGLGNTYARRGSMSYPADQCNKGRY